MLCLRLLGATVCAAGFFATSSTAALADASAVTPSFVYATAPVNVLVHPRSNAPADEYFGRFKISILGVRNIIADVDARADSATADTAQVLCHKLFLAEDALRDWQSKYPDDAWLPRFGYAMLKVYEKLDNDDRIEDSQANAHATDLAIWLDHTYPQSEFAPK